MNQESQTTPPPLRSGDPMARRYPARSRGFTLTELLIVIVIVVTIAGLVFAMASRAIRSARSTKDMSNLRECGNAITILASDLGYYPPGYMGLGQAKRDSWVSNVIRNLVGEDSETNQMPLFWSPLYEREIPATLKGESITHFGANPYIMTDGSFDRDGNPIPKFVIRPMQLMRPSSQFLLCSVPPQTQTSPYHQGHSIVWWLRNKAGNATPTTGIPQSDPALSERSIGLSVDLTKKQQFNAYPDFYRYGTGKGQFFFVDGHVEGLTPTDMKQKHLAVSY